MSRSQRCVDKPATTPQKANVDVMQAHVEDDLLTGAPHQKSRNRIDVRNLSFKGETGRHTDDGGLAHAFHEKSLRKLLLEILQRVPTEIRTNEHDTRIFDCEIVDRFKRDFSHSAPPSSASNADTSASVMLVL